MFISEAFAQGGAVASGSVGGTLIQLGAIFLIFYILLIRPQQKKIKQHEAMLNAIKKGDKVITGGGIYATVVKADSPIDLTVEIAKGIEVEVNRGTIRDVLSTEEVQAKEKTAAIKADAAKAVKKAKAKKPANSNKTKTEKTKK